MATTQNIGGLVEEYDTLFQEVRGRSTDSLERKLVRDAEWTPQAAEHLLRLARDYGSFMLRNALAISLALNIEDGELGF
ncbi:MAG TPA: hypothetical protein VLI39_02720 [Sedimentisphaerales bacterium]|nr:hypothetical protein [Sedimentisphaerales bacterium]